MCIRDRDYGMRLRKEDCILHSERVHVHISARRLEDTYIAVAPCYHDPFTYLQCSGVRAKDYSYEREMYLAIAHTSSTGLLSVLGYTHCASTAPVLLIPADVSDTAARRDEAVQG